MGRSVGLVFNLISVALGIGACHSGVPAPKFVTPFDSTPPAEIRSYLDQLKFDTTDGVGDIQPLTVGCPSACRPGPEVEIRPEKRAHHNKDKSLAVGPGRIIARLINHDSTETYLPLNLGPLDTAYWAVDQVKPTARNLSTGRSLYISAAVLRGERRSTAQPIPMHVRKHPDYGPWKQALMRWVPVDSTYDYRGSPGGSDEEMARMRTFMSWGNCKSQSCCGP